jgi:flagellar motility protein MotE (MotC chaperone)
MRIRLLHLLIFGCITLLGIKTMDMYQRNKSLSEILFVSSTSAEEKPPAEEVPATEEEKNSESNNTEDPTEEEETGEETEEEAVKDFREELTFTETEVEILRRLQQRRAKLEQWEETLKVKDNVLKVTQTKIDQKLKELRSLKNEVVGLLKEYNKKDDAKLRSLVKIYESMKPKNAAKIFENLDMAILLEVIDKMKESKSALILAKMNSERAKELTVLYAEQRKLSEATR